MSAAIAAAASAERFALFHVTSQGGATEPREEVLVENDLTFVPGRGLCYDGPKMAPEGVKKKGLEFCQFLPKGQKTGKCRSRLWLWCERPVRREVGAWTLLVIASRPFG